jgi:hypothetical protein
VKVLILKLRAFILLLSVSISASGASFMAFGPTGLDFLIRPVVEGDSQDNSHKQCIPIRVEKVNYS